MGRSGGGLVGRSGGGLNGKVRRRFEWEGQEEV